MGMKKAVVLSVILAIGLCLALFLVEVGLGQYIVPAATIRDMMIQKTAPVLENPQNVVVDPDDTLRPGTGVVKIMPKGGESAGKPESLKRKR